MKVIDLLNKIANGEEVPNFIIDEVEYYMGANGYLRECMGDDAQWYIDKSWLNTEARILEEPKGIPEKLSYYSMEKIQKAKNKDEWQEERISLLEKRVEDLHIKMNELLDYLESKGE